MIMFALRWGWRVRALWNWLIGKDLKMSENTLQRVLGLLERLDGRFDSLTANIDSLINKVDGLSVRLDRLVESDAFSDRPAMDYGRAEDRAIRTNWGMDRFPDDQLVALIKEVRNLERRVSAFEDQKPN
jgi:hypothetical protein